MDAIETMADILAQDPNNEDALKVWNALYNPEENLNGALIHMLTTQVFDLLDNELTKLLEALRKSEKLRSTEQAAHYLCSNDKAYLNALLEYKVGVINMLSEQIVKQHWDKKDEQIVAENILAKCAYLLSTNIPGVKPWPLFSSKLLLSNAYAFSAVGEAIKEVSRV